MFSAFHVRTEIATLDLFLPVRTLTTSPMAYSWYWRLIFRSTSVGGRFCRSNRGRSRLKMPGERVGKSSNLMYWLHQNLPKVVSEGDIWRTEMTWNNLNTSTHFRSRSVLQWRVSWMGSITSHGDTRTRALPVSQNIFGWLSLEQSIMSLTQAVSTIVLNNLHVKIRARYCRRLRTGHCRFVDPIIASLRTIPRISARTSTGKESSGITFAVCSWGWFCRTTRGLGLRTIGLISLPVNGFSLNVRTEWISSFAFVYVGRSCWLGCRDVSNVDWIGLYLGGCERCKQIPE